MTNSPETNQELLLRIRDSADREAWIEFEQFYRPVVFRVARSLNLQEADALNVVQEVMVKIENSIDRWTPDQPPGSFRNWLRKVARNAALDAIRKKRPDASPGGSAAQLSLNAVAEPDQVLSQLRVEVERQAFRWAADRIKHEFHETTWNAFWQTMIEGVPCEVFAKETGKSIGSVYTSRSRVMHRLKSEVQLFDWDQHEDWERQGLEGQE